MNEHMDAHPSVNQTAVGSKQNENYSRKISKSKLAYLRIREMIFRNELQPGNKISEDELATLLMTSRTPVREALRQLRSEGLITIYPNQYAEVTYFTPELIQRVGIVRMSQDILSGHLAIYYGSNADFQHLYELADICERENHSGDLYTRISADRNFHLGITRIGKNELLYKYQQEVYYRIHLIQLQNNADQSAERIPYHLSLINYLFQRDKTAFTNAVCYRCQDMYNFDDAIIEPYLKHN